MKKSVKIIVICLIIVAIFIAIDIINNKVEQNNINNNIIDETTNNINENYISNVVNKNNKVTDNSSIIECKEKVKQIMSKMTLEEKVGQIFLARYPSSGVTNEIEDGKPGGYILFGRDFDNKTKSKIISELKNDQKASKIKMILGVDEEGGTVVRVSSHKAFRSSKFLSPQEIYNKGGIDAVLQDSEEKSGLLKSLGINMNLAPVADITSNTNAFIYKRTLGRDVQTTANYIAEIVKNMKQSNIISVLKHFPGYGDNVDTHTGIAIDERTMEEFEQTDFIPFQSGIQNGTPCILVNHNIVKCMDSTMPASLSKNVHEILRNKLNFTGVVITDDLAMDAVKKYAENNEAAVQAVLAGNDMIISSDFLAQKQEVLDEINAGKIDIELIDNAVERILSMKYAYGIISD